MLTFIKAAKVTKVCIDKLYVASILRIKVLSTSGAGEEYDPKQQATAEFIDNIIE